MQPASEQRDGAGKTGVVLYPAHPFSRSARRPRVFAYAVFDTTAHPNRTPLNRSLRGRVTAMRHVECAYP